MYVSRTRKEKLSSHDENCQQNASDLEGSLVTSSRPPGRPQKRPDDRTSNGGVAAQAADGSQRTASAADEQCRNRGSVIIVQIVAHEGFFKHVCYNSKTVAMHMHEATID